MPCEARRRFSNPRIVEIDGNGAVGANVPIERAFFPSDTGQAVQSFEMRRRHRSNDADVGIGDLGQALNLARMIGAELDHRHLVLLAQTQKRQRQPDQIVEISFRLKNFAAQPLAAERSFFENRRDHFFSRRFAIGTGDRQHLRGKLLPSIVGQIAQGRERVSALLSRSRGQARTSAMNDAR